MFWSINLQTPKTKDCVLSWYVYNQLTLITCLKKTRLHWGGAGGRGQFLITARHWLFARWVIETETDLTTGPPWYVCMWWAKGNSPRGALNLGPGAFTFCSPHTYIHTYIHKKNRAYLITSGYLTAYLITAHTSGKLISRGLEPQGQPLTTFPGSLSWRP
jgi:hypothetical protein